MRKVDRSILIFALILICIGFAAVGTVLYVSGTLTLATNDDFDVYFSGAELDNVDVSNVVIKDKTHIEFTTNDLSSINDTSTLMYEVTNGSKQYDADISIECSPMKTNYYEVTLDPTNMTVVAGKVKQGNIEIKLTSVSSEEQDLKISCELKTDAVERTETGDDVEEHGDYSIAGYFVNEDGTPVSNANLVVYSDTPHYITTDMYGYFYVENLERGLHEIYYLNTLSDPESMTKEEIISSAEADVKVATNNSDDIVFDNEYEIKDSVTAFTNDATYEVTFDTGDTEIEVTQNHRYGTLPTPTKKGYNFNGWYYKDKLINEDTIAVESETHELTARWIANKYTITFDANSGSVDTLTKEVTFDSKVGEIPTPTRYGYTFGGWYYGDIKYTSDTVYEVDDNITLIAKWTANTYTLTYDANGGSVSSSTKNVTFGENYGTLETPTRTGYTFSGWYYGDTKITSDSIVSVADNITLKADWTANVYVLSFNANGGSVSTKSINVSYGSTYGTLPTPTRTSNYKFAGWYTEVSGGTIVTSSTVMEASDVTVYAHWTVLCSYAPGQTWNYDYSGGEQNITIPCAGVYKLETWGAAGGYAYDSSRKTGPGGYGGYSVGSISLSKSTVLYINVGGAGSSNCNTSSCAGGYNGGSASVKWAGGTSLWTGGGGGATHIATKSGVLKNLSSSQSSVLIVSGGGGGGDMYLLWSSNHNQYSSTGGNGGGYIGVNGICGVHDTSYPLGYTCGTPGTQTSGYAFGTAGTSASLSDSTGGSGGGWYGGYSSIVHATGSGGSGYIGNASLTNKVMYCYNCTASTEASTKTVSTTCASSTATSNCAKSGNGYARITLVSLD